MVFVERLAGLAMDLQLIDLNVWNHHGIYWQIDIYPDMHDHQEPEMIIYLSQTQVEMLKLDEGDDDWWTDPMSFIYQQKNMPRKVRRILESLEDGRQ
jgi:hypothetical protein